MANSQFVHFLKENFPNNFNELVDKFSRYAAILERESKIHNLTAINPSEYEEKHFLDSLLLGKTYAFSNETLIDVGTGAGFPGLVLAIAYKDLKVTLLEPTRKRCDFLAKVVEALNLNNVTIINERAEDYVKVARGTYDLATSRAVANFSIILELSVPLLKVGGSALVMKGKSYPEELKDAQKAIDKLKIECQKVDTHTLDSDSSIRMNARFVKKSETSPKYPRPYSQIKKNPL